MVNLLATPDAGVSAYAVEDSVPAGLTVSSITGGGSWDSVNRKVKWGPFFDINARTLTYQLSGSDGSYTFSGSGSFDGGSVGITGDRELVIGGGGGSSTVVSTITPSAGGGTVSLLVTPNAGVSAYAVEDSVPASLTVSSINGGGSWDSVNRKVKWGPFFDSNARTLTYQVSGSAGSYTFSGSGSFDGGSVPVTGDRELMVGPTGSAEIEVSYNGTIVVDGDTTPSIPEGTDFGSVPVGTSVVHEFTIRNLGDGLLEIPSFGSSNPDVFRVPLVAVVTGIAPGGAYKLGIAFDPPSPGSHSAMISFATNDSDENPFNFTVRGDGVPPVVDDHGDSTATATGIAVNSTTAGDLEIGGDNDYFRLLIAEAGSLSVEATGSTDTYGYLLDATGAALAFSDDDGTGTNFKIVRSISAGTYYIRVKGDGATTTGGYQLVCSFSPMGDPDNQIGTLGLAAGGTLNGQVVDATQRTIVVAPGATISGTIVVDANNLMSPGAVVPLGGTVDWGDRETQPWQTAGDIPTGLSQHTVAVSKTAPTEPGTYHLVIAFAGEYNMSQIMSRTNWTAGSTVWNDGNDVAFDWGADDFSAAATGGAVLTDLKQTTGFNPVWLPATVVTIQVSPPPAEIAVAYNAANIADGDTTPSIPEGTDFGSITQGGSTVSRTFTVTNSGGSTLTLGAFTVPAGFTVTEALAASLAAGASDTFTVRLDNALVGTKTGDVSFINGDSSESPFNFRVTGTVNPPPAEIAVRYDGTNIADGDTIPSTADGTNFGTIIQGGSTVSRTFSVTNMGGSTLTLGSVSVPSGFTLTNGLSSSLSAGASDTFVVRLDSTSVGTKMGQISFTNGDSNESPFNFTITGVVEPVVLPTVTTTAVTNISETGATTGGNVTASGGAAVTQRGIVFGTSPNPTTSNATFLVDGGGTGSWVESLNGLLTAGTTYYVRAFAINSAGTAYGNQEGFTTTTISIADFPYAEGFEIGLGVWGASAGNDFDWAQNTGATSSSGTGPSVAATGTGYAYTEASSPNSPAKTAGMEATFDFSSLAAPELSFAYHMFGAAMGSLSVDVLADGVWATDVWKFIGQQQLADTDSWVTQIVDLSAYAGKSRVVIRLRGVTGSGFTSDMAVDDIQVVESVPANNIGTLRLAVGGNLNGSSIDSGNHTITVSPGEAISGSLRVEANNLMPGGSVAPLGGTVDWGDRTSQPWLVNGWIGTGINQFSIPVNKVAPTVPGTYHVIVAFAGEFNMSQVMSRTNWTAGPVVWNDGNDVGFDWTEGDFAMAVRYGAVLSEMLNSSGYVSGWQPATVVTIEVVPSVVEFGDWIDRLGVPVDKRGPNDDAAGDGVANIIKYAQGIDPMVTGLSGLRQIERPSSAELRAWFLRSLSADDSVEQVVRWSRDLITWHESGVTEGGTTVTLDMSETQPDPSNSGREWVRVDASVTGDSAGALFLRLDVRPLLRYGGMTFSVTNGVYQDQSDWNAAVESEFGAEWEVAEWNTVKSIFGGDDAPALALAEFLAGYASNSAYATFNGSRFWPSSPSRYYFMSAHFGSLPGGYLAHDNIRGYTVSLGSWYGSNQIFVRKVAP